jgi:O-antigen/teichoic acid export membrane protein
VHDAGITFAIRLAGAGAAFALQALLSRIMAPSEFGGYILVWSWLLSLGSLATLGLAELTIRIVPRYASRNRAADLAAYFRFGLKSILIGSGTLAMLGTVAALMHVTEGHTRNLVILVALGLPFIAIEYFLDDVARALGYYRLTSIPIYVVRPIAIGSICLAIWLMGFTLDSVIVSVVVIAMLAATSLAVFPAIRQQMQRAAASSGLARRKLWFSAALPMLASASMNDLILNGDVVLVGLLLSEKDAAIYFVASRVLIIASFAQHALHYVFGRRFSIALAERRMDVLRRDFWNSTAVALLASVGAAALGMILAPWLLRAFSAELQSAAGLVALVAIAFIARGASAQAHEYLTVVGETPKLLLINAVSIAIAIVGSFLVAPLHGMQGVILAIGFAAILRAALLLAVAIGKLKNAIA